MAESDVTRTEAEVAQLNNDMKANYLTPLWQIEEEQGDMFVIPSWACHEHLNASGDERAILFSMHDTPLMVMLNKYREEAYTENGGHQPVTGVFGANATPHAP